MQPILGLRLFPTKTCRTLRTETSLRNSETEDTPGHGQHAARLHHPRQGRIQLAHGRAKWFMIILYLTVRYQFVTSGALAYGSKKQHAQRSWPMLDCIKIPQMPGLDKFSKN